MIVVTLFTHSEILKLSSVTIKRVVLMYRFSGLFYFFVYINYEKGSCQVS